MLKKIAAFTLLSLISAGSAQAALMETEVQKFTFSGPSGVTSTEPGVNPFVFNKFDDTLGALNNVFFRAFFQISGGLIGADNMSNDVVTGSGELGARLSLTSSIPLLNPSFSPIFTPIEVSQLAQFTLAADPTLSVGGNGPDVATLYGATLSDSKGWTPSASFLLGNFIGQGQTFTIDYRADSLINVSVPGAQGFFQVPNVYIEVEMYYQYIAPTIVTPPPQDVNAPFGLAIAGLSLMGLGAARRKKAEK